MRKLVNTQLVLTRKLWVRSSAVLVALALVAAACSGTETASAPDVAADEVAENPADDTDGDTTADNADADDGTTTTDTAAETAVVDDENLDAYEGLNEGEIESAKREEEVRRVIARAEAADAVETQPSETRETDTQSTDTQPEETQPSVPRFDADGTERLGDRAADYDPEFGISERTVVIPDVRGQKYFVDAGTANVGQWVYVDARGPLEGETISRTYDFEAYTLVDGEDKARRNLYKYWNEPVPIRENLDIRLRANERLDVVSHRRLFGWEKVGTLLQYGGFPVPSGKEDVREPIHNPPTLPEGQGTWFAQEWYVYQCAYTRDGVERPAGEGSLRLFRVLELGTEPQLLGRNGGVAWMKSGESGTGVPGSKC